MAPGDLGALTGSWEVEPRIGLHPSGRVDGTADGHIFWFDEVGDAVRCVWNGFAGEPFQLVPQRDGEILVFSPDDSHIAYYGQRDGGWFVGVDGRELGPYEGITRSVPPTFSSAGDHVAFGAYVGGRFRLILDGEAQGEWRAAPVPPVFSPDGTRLAFVAENRELAPRGSRSGYRQWIVLDGVAQPEADGISVAAGGIQFSPDSRRFAYGSISDDQLRFVVDGVAGRSMRDARGPTFSPDSQVFAYAAQLGRKMAMVVDEQAGTTYELVAPPVFSPDSSRVAFAAVPSKRRLVAVVDGVEGPPFLDVWGEITFSPNSRRTAYLAIEAGAGPLGRFRTSGRSVIDGIASKDSWTGFSSNPHFSADSDHVAFSASQGKRHFVVLDGAPGPDYDDVGPPRFSPTGRLAYVARSSGSTAIVVDETPGPAVEEPNEVKPNEMFVFSPDGEHVATVGRLAGGWRPIVDDRIGPAFAGVGRIRFVGNRACFMAVGADGAATVSTRL